MSVHTQCTTQVTVGYNISNTKELPGFDTNQQTPQKSTQQTPVLKMTAEEMTSDITFKTKSFPFTFGKGNLKSFLSELTTFTEKITKIDDGPKPWKSIWTTWKSKGITTATSRRKLANIILGTNYDYRDDVKTTQQKVIKAFTSNLPFMNDIIKFTKDENDDELWKASFADDDSVNRYYGLYTENDVNLKDEPNDSTPPSTEEPWTDIVSGKNSTANIKIAKLTSVPDAKEEEHDNNPFNILSEIDSPTNTGQDNEHNDDDDHLISYDDGLDNASISAPTPSTSNKSPQLRMNKTLVNDPFDQDLTEHELTQVLDIIHNKQVQDDNIAEEVSVAVEETQPEDPEIGASEVTSLVILFHSISLLLLISFLLML